MATKDFNNRLDELVATHQCGPESLYSNTELMKTLDDETLQQIWDHRWLEQTMLCEAFQDLWDAVGDNEEAAKAINKIARCLKYHNPFDSPGWFLSDDGQDFTRISTDGENIDFWNAFRARTTEQG